MLPVTSSSRKRGPLLSLKRPVEQQLRSFFRRSESSWRVLKRLRRLRKLRDGDGA